MSDPNFQEPQPGDPGTPRDVNRESDVVWDGNDPERYAGQTPEQNTEESKRATKKSTAKKSTSAQSDSQE